MISFYSWYFFFHSLCNSSKRIVTGTVILGKDFFFRWYFPYLFNAPQFISFSKWNLQFLNSFATSSDFRKSCLLLVLSLVQFTSKWFYVCAYDNLFFFCFHHSLKKKLFFIRRVVFQCFNCIIFYNAWMANRFFKWNEQKEMLRAIDNTQQWLLQENFDLKTD